MDQKSFGKSRIPEKSIPEALPGCSHWVTIPTSLSLIGEKSMTLPFGDGLH